MQLMAGIRLCTMRPITNHPHFEDKELRIRTKELYKMYGQFAPEEVYETMVKYNTSFMILEDSQCMNYGRPDRCGLPDTVVDYLIWYHLGRPDSDGRPLEV